MRLSLTSSKASNWVDRGESAIPQLERVLQFFFERHNVDDLSWIRRAAEDILGMVAADATDIQIAGYLKSLARAQNISFPPKARLTSLTLWHIAKAALVRDAASALLNSDLASRPEQPPLSEWLAARLLSPSELARLESEGVRSTSSAADGESTFDGDLPTTADYTLEEMNRSRVPRSRCRLTPTSGPYALNGFHTDFGSWLLVCHSTSRLKHGRRDWKVRQIPSQRELSGASFWHETPASQLVTSSRTDGVPPSGLNYDPYFRVAACCGRSGVWE